MRERIRTIIRQVCRELGVQIVSGVLSREHVHMFVEIPPHVAVSDFVRCVKGRSSHRVQMEFPDLRKRYWRRHFWVRGYFSTPSGNITDDVILQYLKEHEPTRRQPVVIQLRPTLARAFLARRCLTRMVLAVLNPFVDCQL